VKYQSTILFTMTIAFKQIVSCEKLGMLWRCLFWPCLFF
jgi:hypothetical protein